MHSQRKVYPPVAREYTLPQQPTFVADDDGWTLHEGSEVGGQPVVNVVADTIMSSSNGRIGLRGSTDSEEDVVLGEALVNGAFEAVPVEHPGAESVTLPVTEDHLCPCYTYRIRVTDSTGSPITCVEMRQRSLDMRRGVTIFESRFGNEHVSFLMKWERFTSVSSLESWWGRLQITDVCTAIDPEDVGSVQGVKFDAGHINISAELVFEDKRWDVNEKEKDAQMQLLEYSRRHFTVKSRSAARTVVASFDAKCTAKRKGSEEDEVVKFTDETISALPMLNALRSTSMIFPGMSGIMTPQSPLSSEVDESSPGRAGSPSGGLSCTQLSKSGRVSLNELEGLTVVLSVTSSVAEGSGVEEEIHLCPPANKDNFQTAFDAHAKAVESLWAGYTFETRLQDDPQELRLLAAQRFSAYTLLTNGAGCAANLGITRSGLAHGRQFGQVSMQDLLYTGLFYCFTAPQLATNVVDYLFSLLPAARDHARALSFAQGALYPFHTISGKESGVYFLNSTARFHINADIAYVIAMYLETCIVPAGVQLNCLEMLLETARVWVELGQWLDGDTVFAIDGVSGPDAYNALANDNFYTHLGAKRHMKNALEQLKQMTTHFPDEVADLLSRIGMDEDQLHRIRDAFEGIVIERNDRLGVYFAHQHFDSQPRWESDMIRYPLSVNYHPLVIYRHKICELPEVLMGMLMHPDRFERTDMRLNLRYYEPLCTNDNPISLALLGAMKFRAWQDFGKGTEELRLVSQMDLENLVPVSEEGLHLACMACPFFMGLIGVAGVKVVKGTLHLAPSLPVSWEIFRIAINWRGAKLLIEVTAEEITYTLEKGDSIRFIHFDTNRVHLHHGLAGCVTQIKFPRWVQEQVTAHFDGVILMLESVVKDLYQLHFRSWRNSLERLFDDIRIRENREIESLTFEEYAEKVLYQVEQADMEYTGIDSVLQSRGIHLELGNPSDAEVVESRFGLANAKRAEMSEILAEEVDQLSLVEGASELLMDLRRLGLRVAIVSYTRSMTEVLKALPLLRGLSTITIDGFEAREKQFRGRPHTDLFVKAARKMHLSSDRCVVIGSQLDRGYQKADMQKFHVWLDVVNYRMPSPHRDPHNSGSMGDTLASSPMFVATDPSSSTSGTRLVSHGSVSDEEDEHQASSNSGGAPGNASSGAPDQIIKLPEGLFPKSVSVLEDWIFERQRVRRKRSLSAGATK